MRVRRPRKVAPPPPDVDALIKRINDAAEGDLASVLGLVQIWRFPRGDMHAWVSVTKKFGTILESMRNAYSFGTGSSKQCKLQLNEFTPKDKELVLEILRFTRMLLENCTNRKLFDGYEVINDLLLTNDLDVLNAALYVLLRPLQQYNIGIPTSTEVGSSIRHRLLTLSRGWDRLSDLAEFASSAPPLTLPEEATHVQLQFYPPQGSVAPAEASSPVKSIATAQPTMETPTRPSNVRTDSRAAVTPLPSRIATSVESTMVTVDLGNVAESMNGDYLDRLASLVEEHPMSTDDQLVALNKVRLVVLSKDRDTRRKLLACRLMALAGYSLFSSEEALQSTIFLYEPELVNQIGELLVPECDVGDSVRASALISLEAASRHRHEVLTSINAHVSHGAVMNLLRLVVQKLVQGEDVSQNVVDALLAMVAFISAQPVHGNHLVGAGLIPVLLEVLAVPGERRSQYIARAIGIVEQATFGHAQGIQSFQNSDALNIIVGRIKIEAQTIAGQPLVEADGIFSRDSLIAYNANGLRALLRAIYRMIQSTGGADGFRNVVDSDLPKSLKVMFVSHEKFGPRVFSLAVNIMATMVHNEPTSLAILQEQSVPQTLYDELEANMPESFESVHSLPNAIGAICLNAQGLQATIDHFIVVDKIIRVAVGWPNDELSDRDPVTLIGSALDELVRHHPSLRSKVLDSVLNLLRETLKEGEEFKPSPQDVNEYPIDPSCVDTSMDVEETPKEQAMPLTNPPLAKLTNIMKLLNGLLGNRAMCNDFTEAGGLDLVLSMADLPCVPVRFSATEMATTMPSLLRIIGEHDQTKLAEALMASVQKDLDSLPELWKDADARGHWTAMLKEDGSPEDHKRMANACGLATRLSFLADYLNLNSSGQRLNPGLVKALGVSTGKPLVPDLGLLHRVAFMQHVLLKDIKDPVVEAAKAAATAKAEADKETTASAPAHESGEEPAQPSSTEGAVTTPVEAPGDAISNITTPLGDTKVPWTRIQAVKTMVARIHALLTKFFRATIRLIYTKRMPDNAQKAEANALADCISDIIMGHLQASSQFPQKALGVDTVSLGLATILLFDERGADGHLSTTLFIPFDKKGGMGVLLENIQRILKRLDALPEIDAEERTAEQKDEWAQCLAGARIAIPVLSAFSSPRSLLESGQTHVVEQRESASGIPQNRRFSAVATFVRIRRDVFPLAHHVWNAPWITSLPPAQLRMAASTFLEIMAGKNEEMTVAIGSTVTPEPIARAPSIPRPQITADPTRVAQLVDMGFGRVAAERALLRARNSVAAAADLILSMPHLFPNEEPEPAAPEPAAEQPAADAPAAAAANATDTERAGEQTPPTDAAAPAVPAQGGESSSTPAQAEGESSTPPAQTEGGTTAVASTSDTQAGESAMEVDPVPSPTTVWESQREELQKLRDEAKPDLPSRAMELLDNVEELVFDLLPAFPSGADGVRFIIDRLAEAVAEEPHRDAAISARLRLLSVFARANQQLDLDTETSERAMSTIMKLQVDTAERPSWLPGYLLAAESIFLMTCTITDTKIGEPATKDIVRTADFGDAPRLLLETCLQTLAAGDVKREDVISCMRLLVILTRHDPKLCSAELVGPILNIFKTSNFKLVGSQPYVAMVMRHAFDDKDVLKEIMTGELRNWQGRNKVSDATHFVRMLRQMVYRDTNTFLDVVDEDCTLVDPSPPSSIYHIRSKKSDKDGDNDDSKIDDKPGKDVSAQAPSASDPFTRSGVDTFETHPAMDLLLSDLGATMRTIQQEETAKRAGTPFTPAAAEAYAYSGFILSLITELVGSYYSAKKAFMAGLRHGAMYGIGKGKTGFPAFLNDLVCCASLSDVAEKLSGSNGVPELRRLAMSSWASSLIVALCANVTPTSDMKQVPEELVIVRKSVLDGIAKALKDNNAHLDMGSRYGRLWALGELIHRLLTVRQSAVPRLSDESSVSLAKAMFEKNYVSILTSAVSEIDLNYPNVRNALVSLLKALEHLTKISIKWGKSENKHKDGEDAAEVDSDDESDSDESSNMDMSDEEGDAPDLYRNSALGILGGDIGEDDEDDGLEEDDMDDEEMMEAFGEDMDDGMDDEDTEPSSDEDDDDLDGDEDDDMGEWSTEDEVEEGGEENPITIDSDEEDEEMIEVDDGVPWDEDGMMEGEEVFDSDGEEEDGFVENEFGFGFDMEHDEMEEDYDDDGFDDLDEFDAMDGIPSSVPGASSEMLGHWGWLEPTFGSGDASRSRSRLREMDAATTLFGLAPRATDNVQHPLLQGPRPSPNLPRQMGNPFGALTSLQDLMMSVQSLGGPEAVHFLEEVVNRSRTAGEESIRVDLNHRHDGGFGINIGGRSFTVGPRSRSDPSPSRPVTAEEIQGEYKPRPTMQRWSDEANVFPYHSQEQVARLVKHIVNRLLPGARKAAEEEAERLRKEEEEEEKQRKKEEEEAQAAASKQREQETAQAAAVALPESRPDSVMREAENDDVEMASDDGEEDESGDEDEQEPPEDSERVTITIHGEEIDITDTGIDLEFLQALPEDMRADVVEQHLREQNRLARPPAPNMQSASQISPEFLEALPPDIRAEVIMQETIEQARRQQPPANDQRVLSPPMAHEDLFDMDRELLNILSRSAGLPNPRAPVPGASTAVEPARPKRDAIQLLDKPGIASLVRLLFFPEALRQGYLFRTLINLCENSKTRADLLNLLLSIVQDGTGDLPAVDRSFQQMSLRGLATTTPKATPKGKAPETPAPFTSGLFAHLQMDHIPTFIAQRCFDALLYIVGANQQVVTYFLTEHEQPVGLKKPPSKKGKGKEKYLPQTKFPIVILIGLLDRSALMKTPGMMESLTSLLAGITKPLANLPSATEEKKDDKPEPSATAPPAAGAVAAITGTAAAPTTTAATQPADATAVATTQPATTTEAAVATGAAESSVQARATKTTTPPLKAPTIPPSVLRLVINCLTIGDTTSRTFSNTLILLQNLSYIPDAKGILVQELCTRSQQLGVTIQEELRELAGVLADTSHDISATMLGKFTPGSSSQAQFLRLLKTIDYLHSRKGPNLEENEKQGRTIFQSFDFVNMWRQLSDCLSLAEERESTEHIAALLLPLVESLMVVCKYTRPTSGTGEIMSPVLSPMSPMSNATPPPTDLFMSFTTTHRKVLNAIVRNNPSLMSGSFSLLIANSRVLEFDNKRTWFFQKLRRRREQMSYPSLHLNVRRQYVFQDSFSALLHRPGDELKYAKINVKFINEDGVDAGGVTREWYHVLAQQIFDPNFALFEPCAADKQTYQPNKHSSVVDDHLSFFKFVGRVIGKAIYDGRLLDAYFSRAFYKQILGRQVDMRDLESIDPEYHKSLQWMLDNDITDIIDQEFTIEDDSFGEKKIVELKEGGASIAVTEENKEEYVRLVCAYRLENSIKDQMSSFLTGFYEMIPRTLIQIFEPDQLELLISGITTIDVDELRNSTQMSGWKNSDSEISWFWRALRSFSTEERSRFLMFVTSSSRVPLGGFSQLVGASGIQPFQIQRLYGKEGILPQASTCFNLLLLPKYASYEQLRERLLFAVTETSGFGKA